MLQDLYEIDPDRWHDVQSSEDLDSMARELDEGHWQIYTSENVRRRLVEWTAGEAEEGRLVGQVLKQFAIRAGRTMRTGGVKSRRREKRAFDYY